MVSHAGREVLEVVQRNTGASYPTTADPFPAKFIDFLRTMKPELLAHPTFTEALICAVDRVPGHSKEAVSGALTLASGMVEILVAKNVKHIIWNDDARRRGSGGDKTTYKQQDVQEVPDKYHYLRDGPLPKGEYFASDNPDKNRNIVDAGQVIRASTIERLRGAQVLSVSSWSSYMPVTILTLCTSHVDDKITFGSPEYVSTPSGPALTKPYLELVLYVIGDVAYCRRITSKGSRGLDAVHKEQKSNYLAILPEVSGEDEAKWDGNEENAHTPTLFTRDMGSHAGSMLCLEETTVSLRSWITPQAGHFSEASLAKIREAVLKQAHVKQHMANFPPRMDRPQGKNVQRKGEFPRLKEEKDKMPNNALRDAPPLTQATPPPARWVNPRRSQRGGRQRGRGQQRQDASRPHVDFNHSATPDFSYGRSQYRDPEPIYNADTTYAPSRASQPPSSRLNTIATGSDIIDQEQPPHKRAKRTHSNS
ncbi:unnamed protein product [Zymoseptoria tritici ST99CH_3D7]|uniref:Uncharacterized protein n=1 Tax=Zymoseptoria tritici (strain ST99CH_3D7) TaxID=1276538 RepID=A0A1X7S1R9_ZYMT9|nr:unnamed protein product [Zymoseptoria tritici ST99CH_3D7]